MSSNDTARDTARPRFYKDAVENPQRTREEGRPIFDEVEMVEVIIPGDRLTRFVDLVQDKHKERWPDQYAAFKRGEARAASGTPLEHWPVLTTGKVAELKAMNILSVEELAGLPDNILGKLGMGARDLREQARTFIDAARGGADTSAMAAQIAQLQAMVEALTKGGAAVTPPSTNSTPAEPQSKPIEDCTDAELKAFIKERTGEAVRGNPSRETLIARATELALEQSEAA